MRQSFMRTVNIAGNEIQFIYDLTTVVPCAGDDIGGDGRRDEAKYFVEMEIEGLDKCPEELTTVLDALISEATCLCYLS